MNDARAEAYADHWFNGKPEDEKIYIMLGEGVGGAYINASAIRNGVHNRGGEFGHMVFTLEESSACVVRRAVLKHMFQKRYYHQSLI